MPLKQILVSHLEDHILRSLSRLLWRRQDVRLFSPVPQERPQTCQTELLELGEFNPVARTQLGDLGPLDEIWHTRCPSHSTDQNRTLTRQLLSLAQEHRRPRINYVSSIYAAGCGETLNECPAEPNGPGLGPEEDDDHWNEQAIEQSGCAFRIFRVPPLANSFTGSLCTRFIGSLCRFREKVEDRLPLYFCASPLHIVLPQAGTAKLIYAEAAAEVLDELLLSPEPVTYFHVIGHPPIGFQAHFSAIARLTGVHLSAVSDTNELNAVDRLFHLRVEKALPYLSSSPAVSYEQTLKHSLIARAQHRRSVDPDAIWSSSFDQYRREAAHHESYALHMWSVLRRERLLLSDGATANYYAGGEGDKTVVVLNALGQGVNYWKKTLSLLLKDFKVIVWLPRGNDFDTIGLNQSSSIRLHADDLYQVLRAEHVDACSLLAWCSGTRVAFEFCSKYSAMVSYLICLSASFTGLSGYQDLETAYEKGIRPLLQAILDRPHLASQALDALRGVVLAQSRLAGSSENGKSDNELTLASRLATVSRSVTEFVLEPFNTAPALLAYAQQLREFWSHEFSSELSAISVPVLFIGGDCDRIASQSLCQVVAKTMTRATYLEVKGGSHYLQYEEWDSIAPLISDFLCSDASLSVRFPWIHSIQLASSTNPADYTNGGRNSA